MHLKEEKPGTVLALPGDGLGVNLGNRAVLYVTRSGHFAYWDGEAPETLTHFGPGTEALAAARAAILWIGQTIESGHALSNTESRAGVLMHRKLYGADGCYMRLCVIPKGARLEWWYAPSRGQARILVVTYCSKTVHALERLLGAIWAQSTPRAVEVQKSEAELMVMGEPVDAVTALRSAKISDPAYEQDINELMGLVDNAYEDGSVHDRFDALKLFGRKLRQMARAHYPGLVNAEEWIMDRVRERRKVITAEDIKTIDEPETFTLHSYVEALKTLALCGEAVARGACSREAYKGHLDKARNAHPGIRELFPDKTGSAEFDEVGEYHMREYRMARAAMHSVAVAPYDIALEALRNPNGADRASIMESAQHRHAELHGDQGDAKHARACVRKALDLMLAPYVDPNYPALFMAEDAASSLTKAQREWLLDHPSFGRVYIGNRSAFSVVGMLRENGEFDDGATIALNGPDCHKQVVVAQYAKPGEPQYFLQSPFERWADEAR